MWIRPNTVTGSQSYFSGGGLSLGLEGGRLSLAAKRGKKTWDSYKYNGPLIEQRWQHVTITYSPKSLDDRFQIIVKDTSSQTGNRPRIEEIAANYTKDWTFGAPHERFTDYGNMAIDEVLVWSHNMIPEVVEKISGKYCKYCYPVVCFNGLKLE